MYCSSLLYVKLSAEKEAPIELGTQNTTTRHTRRVFFSTRTIPVTAAAVACARDRMSAHFCTCAASAFHWPSEETLTAAATTESSFRGRVYESQGRPASTVLKVFLVVSGTFKASKKAQFSHFLGISLNKT